MLTEQSVEHPNLQINPQQKGQKNTFAPTLYHPKTYHPKTLHHPKKCQANATDGSCFDMGDADAIRKSANHAPQNCVSQPCVSQLTGKPILHFTHANGIPSQVYEPLFEIWSEHFTVVYIPHFAATAGYAVDNHWQNLTQQIIDSVASACRTHGVRQVVAVGHSLGSLCTLKAVYQAPEQFAQAVLMDPPLIYGHKSLAWHLAKQADKVLLCLDDHRRLAIATLATTTTETANTHGLVLSWAESWLKKIPKPYHFMDKLSPSGLSKRRRDVWASRDDARQSLKDNPFFSAFDPMCFDNYIQYGLTDTFDGQVTLTIPKANEVAVFRSNPSWFWLTPNHAPSRAVSILAGEDSPFVKNHFYQKLQQRLGIVHELTQGGHMFPLMYPTATAVKVLDIIAKQGA